MNTPNNSNSPIDDEQHHRPKSLMEVIFDTKLKESNISEGAVERALDYKVEQEKTKQQYYRLENTNRSIELFKLASDLGVPSCDIARLFSGEAPQVPSLMKNNSLANAATPQVRNASKNDRSSSIGSGATDSLSRQPLSYRFPPAGSNLLPKPVSANNGTRDLNSRRTNSPARIGASAVAALNDSIIIKEEDYPTSGSPFYRKSSCHNRNLSLPITKLHNATIPSGMTSILSFNKENTESTPSASAPTSNSQMISFNNASSNKTSNASSHKNNNGSSIRKPSLGNKKHRRTRSASSFGVIDLNVIDEAKQQDMHRLNVHDSKSNSEKHHDYDEKTCSESSSRNESPVRVSTIPEPVENKNLNPVAKLLNST